MSLEQKKWVIWSEEHSQWWKPGKRGYTRRLREAGRYTAKEAAEILLEANRYLKVGEFNEIAISDPLGVD